MCVRTNSRTYRDTRCACQISIELTFWAHIYVCKMFCSASIVVVPFPLFLSNSPISLLIIIILSLNSGNDNTLIYSNNRWKSTYLNLRQFLVTIYLPKQAHGNDHHTNSDISKMMIEHLEISENLTRPNLNIHFSENLYQANNRVNC